jgi:hypothetical protein
MANVLLSDVWKSMKAFMILGAIIGFLTGAGLSLADGCSWSTALWRACAAALVVAVLARWWSGIWLQNLRMAMRQRRQAPLNIPVKSKPVIK